MVSLYPWKHFLKLLPLFSRFIWFVDILSIFMPYFEIPKRQNVHLWVVYIKTIVSSYFISLWFLKLTGYLPRIRASQGYVFTGICLSKSGGGVTPNASWDRSHGQRGREEWTTSPLSRSQHPLPGQHPPPARWQHLPHPWTTPLSWPGHNTPDTMRRRAVRILLECILVSLINQHC